MPSASGSDSAAACVGGHEALLDGLLAQDAGVHAAAVVLDGDHDHPVGVAGVEAELALGRLADRDALLGRLDAVVEGVADEVAQRVADLLEDGPVELGLLALDDQRDLLAQLRRHVAHDAREAVEDALDRQHAQAGDLVLELAGDPAELLGALLGLAGDGVVAEDVVELAGLAQQAGLLGDELAHEVHEVVEAGDVDPDGLLGGLQALAGDPLLLLADDARGPPRRGRSCAARRRPARRGGDRSGARARAAAACALASAFSRGTTSSTPRSSIIISRSPSAPRAASSPFTSRTRCRSARPALDLLARRDASARSDAGLGRLHDGLVEADARPLAALVDDDADHGPRPVPRPGPLARAGRGSRRRRRTRASGGAGAGLAGPPAATAASAAGGDLEAGAEVGGQGGRVDEGVADRDLLEEVAQDVDRGEERVGERAELGDRARAQGAEHVLHRVREALHPGVADRAGRALERVRRPEHLVDGRRVRLAPLEERAGRSRSCRSAPPTRR